MAATSASAGALWQGPWPWTGAGLLACAVAAAWNAALGVAGDLEPLRLSLIWIGLLLAGIGVARAYRSPPAVAATRMAPVVLTFLALIFAAVAAASTVVLVASWFGNYLIGVQPGLALILWLFVGPLNALSALQCLQRSSAKTPIEAGHQTALILVLTSVVALLARFALSSPSNDFAQNWFTMQRFLLVMAVVAPNVAALTIVDGVTRRWVVSGLVTFHLFGIVTAATSHPPSSWIMSQISSRIYHPYLQFMYLYNAYHFYSPEPGPPSYVWFQLYYTDAQGQKRGQWYKIPQLDDSGRHGHKTSLQYQRLLSVSEHTMRTDSVNTDSVLFEQLVKKRLAATPDGAKQDPIIGIKRAGPDVAVPLNPNYPKTQQHHRPEQRVRMLVETFARHVLHKHQAEFPDRKYESVRIYRVVHRILSIQSYNAGLPPTDPTLYLPVYMGEFDLTGKLIDRDDPLLYWEFPILRDNPADGHSEIKDWARKHAGDPYWRRIIVGGDRPEWVDDDDKPPPPEKK